MKSFQIIRTHSSPYQRADFFEREKLMVESSGDLKYLSLPQALDFPTILITNTHTRLSELPLAVLKNTKLIIHPNSGYDHFSQEYEIWKDIPVVIGHKIRAQAVAEYTLSALFQGRVELPRHLVWQDKRTWNRKLLKGNQVWVFGHGHIGKIIADSLEVIGMRVTVVDPFIKSCRHRHLKNYTEGIISDANVVIAACGLNQSSYHLFNKSFFNELGDEVLFINGARGKLVNEEALRSYLQNTPKSFAFLDVFEDEPFTEAWHSFPQVWKTSHIAGVEAELDTRIIDFSKEVLGDFLNLSADAFIFRYTQELLQNKWIRGELI